ncbi:MAG: hypothetical protein GXO86_07830 [Chlorobi bacterium]|nr:hypothetical protein [Chlorobiota bacterium]
MKKCIHKITGLSFIGTAVLTILLHTVFPHHHHFDSIHYFFDKNHADHKIDRENDVKHCHALNDLVDDKTGVPIIKIIIPESFSALIFENDLSFRIAENTGKKFNVTIRINPFFEDVFLINSPTRGSPQAV